MQEGPEIPLPLMPFHVPWAKQQWECQPPGRTCDQGPQIRQAWPCVMRLAVARGMGYQNWTPLRNLTQWHPFSPSLRTGQQTIQTSNIPKLMTPTDRECSLMENLNQTVMEKIQYKFFLKKNAESRLPHIRGRPTLWKMTNSTAWMDKHPMKMNNRASKAGINTRVSQVF